MGFRRIAAAVAPAVVWAIACGGATIKTLPPDEGADPGPGPTPSPPPQTGPTTTSTPTQGQGECGDPSDDARCAADERCFAAREPFCCTRAGATCTQYTVCCATATPNRDPGGCDANGRCRCGGTDDFCHADTDCCAGYRCGKTVCEVCPMPGCVAGADASADGG